MSAGKTQSENLQIFEWEVKKSRNIGNAYFLRTLKIVIKRRIFLENDIKKVLEELARTIIYFRSRIFSQNDKRVKPFPYISRKSPPPYQTIISSIYYGKAFSGTFHGRAYGSPKLNCNRMNCLHERTKDTRNRQLDGRV